MRRVRKRLEQLPLLPVRHRLDLVPADARREQLLVEVGRHRIRVFEWLRRSEKSMRRVWEPPEVLHRRMSEELPIVPFDTAENLARQASKQERSRNH
jgi:hypothetical protein